MIKYENQCCDCDIPCTGCRRQHTAVMVCDDCGDEDCDLWYGEDGKQYCSTCITHHLEKVEVTDDA